MDFAKHGDAVIPDQLARDLIADYDRRRSTRWGRFLLWLLRNTT